MSKPRRKIWIALGTLAVTSFVTIGAASAAMTFIGTFTTSRSSSAGTTAVDIASFPQFACFLSDVRVEETDSAAEAAECKLIVNLATNRYVLQAILGTTTDAKVFCGAHCYTNP